MQGKFRLALSSLFVVAAVVLAMEMHTVFAETKVSPGEIAQANEETWAAVESVDMEFAVLNETEIDGEQFLTTSLQNRWIFSPEKERLVRVYDLGDEDSLLSDSLLDETDLREHQATSDDNGVLYCGTISPALNPIWHSRVNLAPYLLRYPCGEIDLDTTKTLGWIIENWPTELDGPHVCGEETVWRLRVQCPDEAPWSGGVMQIEVNEDKDFLVQKVTINGLELGGLADEEERTTVEMQIVEFVRTEDGQHYFPSGFVSRQFSEPRTEESRPHTVYKEIPTRLAVNGTLPEHCFDFKFEKFEIVTQYDSLSEITAVYLWGEDNRPMETFASYEELDRWQFRQDISAFVTDYINLAHIIGKDMGHLAHDLLVIGRQYLIAEREHKRKQLNELAPLPIDKANPEAPPAVSSGELLSEETPIKPPQIVETAVAAESLLNEIAPVAPPQASP